MTENEIGRIIVAGAQRVHREMGGPGLLESVYEEALAIELATRSLHVQRQVAFPVRYRGILLRNRIRVDFLVETRIILEIKAVPQYHEAFMAQTLTYLRATNLSLGFVINFGMPVLLQGVKRVVNNLAE
ncbi:MAG: GxxExxY protein [Gemmatimonadaceae bacterium]|nr:GxxExxY protein [Gemmatimonadaceae bacterium]